MKRRERPLRPPRHRKVLLKTQSAASVITASIGKIASTVSSHSTNGGNIQVISSMIAIVSMTSIRVKAEDSMVETNMAVASTVKDSTSRGARVSSAFANGTSATAFATVSATAMVSTRGHGMDSQVVLKDRKMGAPSLRLRRSVLSVRRSPARAFLK